VARLVDRGWQDTDIQVATRAVPYRAVDFAADMAIAAGLLRAVTRPKGFSAGDRACLALAISERLPALTADRAWSQLDLPVEVRLIR
jgi:PIN domain nuclease of toxin-antitoxin system